MKKRFKKIIRNEKIIFIFFVVLVFTAYKDLFNSYFEADEWFHFTYYLPLTQKPDGFFTALISTFTNSGPLSGGQHIIPIASAIFFLNAKFFGLNFVPYAFMTLLLHAINSFLVFLFIKTLLRQKQNIEKNIFAILGAIFFAIPSTAIHAITGAAPFYGQNVLSVTFLLLCVISFKQAYISEAKKFIYLSILFLFLALFSKESAVFLFLVLPFMAFLEKRVFSLKFLGKLFILCVFVFALFRFLVPNIHNLPEKLINIWVDNYISSSYQTPVSAKPVDTGTIVSRDLSIHKNLKQEILFRTVTFPIKMLATTFLPRDTVSSMVKFITPIIYPVPPGGDSTDSSLARNLFMYGPGNSFIIYLISLAILIFCLNLTLSFIRKSQTNEASALLIGLAIIVFASLPLVPIVLSFPRWGYDIYFDSRHYYMPSVGAAILFPFILFSAGNFISKSLNSIRITLPSYFIILFLFLFWLVNNMSVFRHYIYIIVDLTGHPRKEIISQMKQLLPSLSQKAVLYIETDGLGAYGPRLPFQTSVAQVLTVVYYDKNPLPDEFFNEFIFEKTGEGYKEADGRGFGYFTSKKTLSEAILSNSFALKDIYAFYYDSQKIKIKDITKSIRSEMAQKLESNN